MPYEVEEISLSFRAYRRATIDEARALNVLITDKLVQAINKHEKLKPYLCEYPFPTSRVGISISFYSLLDKPYSDGSVHDVSHITTIATTPHKNHLIYDSQYAFADQYVTLVEEPYEEAEKIVRASGTTEPPPHQTTELEMASDEIFQAFAKEMKKECGFRLWGIGRKLQNGIEEIDVKFTSFNHATQEEARELVVFATENLLKLVNGNPKLQPYLEKQPFQSHQIRMKISFRDNKHHSYTDGSMEGVVIDGNEVIYFQDPLYEEGDDLYKLGEPTITYAKEPYREALNIIKNTFASKRSKYKPNFLQRYFC
jgi:hypothetical protein